MDRILGLDVTNGDHHIYLVSETEASGDHRNGLRRGPDPRLPRLFVRRDPTPYGQSSGAPSATGRTDAAIVVTDIDRDGIVSMPGRFRSPASPTRPAPIWSPDGRRIAFVFGWEDSQGNPPAGTGDVWVVTLDTGKVDVVSGVTARADLDLAPDGSRSRHRKRQSTRGIGSRTGGPLLVYSVDSGQLSPLPGATGVMALAWSPDGSRIAYQSIRTPGTPADGGILAGSETQE